MVCSGLVLRRRLLNPRPEDRNIAPGRGLVLYIRSVRLLCLALAIWIGFTNHWSGMAWIPVGALLMVAIVAKVATGVCAIPIRLRLVYQFYRIAYEYSRMSPATRERALSRMHPELRERFSKWLNEHDA